MDFMEGAPSFGGVIRRIDEGSNAGLVTYNIGTGVVEVAFLYPWDVVEGEYVLFAWKLFATGDAAGIHIFTVKNSAGVGVIVPFTGLDRVIWSSRYAAADTNRFNGTAIFRVSGSGSIQPHLQAETVSGNGTVQAAGCVLRGYTLRG